MARYYEFEVSLQELQPRIWRRFLLRTTATFAQLHQAIQQSFGWQESHLWEFRLPMFRGQPIAGLPGGEAYDRPTPDAKTVKLNTYFTGKRVVEWCEYLYDFGDDWTHDVKLIAVHSDKESFKQRLLDGARRTSRGLRRNAGLRAHGPPRRDRRGYLRRRPRGPHDLARRLASRWVRSRDREGQV